MHIHEFLTRLQCVREETNGYRACCPSHDDKHSSLSVRQTDDGKILVNCHANQGCTSKSICQALGLTERALFLNEQTNGHGGNGTGKPPRSEIVNAYDYKDEAGCVRFQTVRFHPKDFRQRRPDGKGGWIWNLGGVSLLLYRLPELLNASPDQTVFVVEGEKDVDKLRMHGLVATCNPMGAGKWKACFNEALRGRTVIILPDNDDPGGKHGDQVACNLRGVAAKVAILALPDLPLKGDVSDWLAHGGTVEQLQQMVADVLGKIPSGETRSTQGKTPRLIPEYQSFPTEVLPSPLRELVAEGSAALYCDAAMISLPALSLSAACIGNTRRIQLKRSWLEPPILWTMIVAESGSGKSPALELVREPIEKIERERREAHRIALAKYQAAQGAWKKGDPLPEKPVMEQILVQDVTAESVALMLQENPRGLLLCKDELRGWINGFTRYQQKGQTSIDVWLEVYHGRVLRVNRKTGDDRAIYVPRASVSVSGTIQPGTLTRLLDGDHYDSGFVARFDLAAPPECLKEWSDATVSMETSEAYQVLAERLLALLPGKDASGKDQPYRLSFSDDARQLWVSFYAEWASKQYLTVGARKAALAKLEAVAARLALIFHCVTHAHAGTDDRCPVDRASLESALVVTRWFAQESERVYAILSESDEAKDHRTLLEVIRRHGGSIRSRQLRDALRKRFPRTEDAEAALSFLVEEGFGNWEGFGNGSKGGRPTRAFVLHPETEPENPET